VEAGRERHRGRGRAGRDHTKGCEVVASPARENHPARALTGRAVGDIRRIA